MASSRTDPQRWRDAKRILESALERAAPERAAFISEACAGDEGLRSDVESLAAAAEHSGSILDEPAPVPIDEAAPRSRVGERIDAYQLIRELGRGGMGVVYLARRADDEFQKKVAIKLVHDGAADELALGRFKSEREISASLDHPHIARLIDGGTTEAGEPYFVMEYVEGEPILDFCERRHLSRRERLRVFQDVCAAVQYAHQNLVVHRDIKPGNILVTPEGVAKLLDFGIAKLLDPGGVSRAGERTATLNRMLTPDYASPEQVRGGPITTASDVYTLGVVLYELLAGRRPYHVTTTEPAELLRLVCEQDPEKPSVVAKSHELRGDLDAIVAKAMRKELEHRYGSAAALSEDIGRHLEGRPVRARRGTVAYRTRKFIRRHRISVAAAALVAVALAGGAFATLRETRRAQLAETQARRRFEDVRGLANSFLFEIHDAIQDLPGSTPARALLVRRGLEYLDGLARESTGDRALRREVAEAYLKLGDVQGNSYMPNLGDVPGALESYGKAIALLEPVVEAGDATDAERATLATAYLVGGGIRLVAGDAEAAVAMAEKGLPLRRDLAEKSPDDVRRLKDLAQAWQFYAFYLADAGREGEAYAALQKQAAILRQRLDVAPRDRQARRSLGQNLYLTGESLRKRGEREGALKTYREAADVQEALRSEEPGSTQLQRDLGYLRTAMGGLFQESRDFDAAREQFRLALALFEAMAVADARSVDGRLGAAMSHHNIGSVAAKSGDRGTALESFEKARRLYEPIVAADPGNSWAAGMLGDLYLDIGEAHAGDAEADAACRMYGLASQTYARVRESGRLREKTAKNAERAGRALARCRETPAGRSSGDFPASSRGVGAMSRRP